MSDSKKDSLNKKINIKNKKEVIKTLNKKKNSNTKAKKTTTTKNKAKEKKIVVEQKVKEEVKETKKIIKPKKIKKTAKKEEKAKLILPKEWKVQPNKNKNKKTSTDTIEATNISGKLKSSIFEEVTEQELQQKKIEDRKNLKKTSITLGIVAVIILVGILIFSKLNNDFLESLRVYEIYSTGEQVILKDGSIWYVVEDSSSSTSTIKLLKDTQIDINSDGKYDNKDKMKYNSTNKATYDVEDKDSVAYYLENEYKEKLTQLIGPIEDISLLTSKEFVKARGKMGYDYEWNEGNWLANSTLGNWWIESSQNGKVYVVTKIGSYKILNASELNFIRPVITIEKDNVEKKD